jgi:hypothetical protein
MSPWLTPVILAIQEAEIIPETLYLEKNPSQKNGWYSGLRYRP